MSDQEFAAKWEAPQVSKRDFLCKATGLVMTVGAAAALWPFIDSMNPSADAVATSKVYVDLRRVKVGDRKAIQWGIRTVLIIHRSPEEIAAAQKVDLAGLIHPQPDSARVQRDEWLIVSNYCTYRGFPLEELRSEGTRGDWEGWFCPYCTSRYDTSGRVRRGPAKRNLYIPAYEFIADGIVVIG